MLSFTADATSDSLPHHCDALPKTCVSSVRDAWCRANGRRIRLELVTTLVCCLLPRVA